MPGADDGLAVAVGHLGDGIAEGHGHTHLVERTEQVLPLGEDGLPGGEGLLRSEGDRGAARVAVPLPGDVVEALRRSGQPVDRGDGQPPAGVPQPLLADVAPGLPLAEEVAHPRMVPSPVRRSRGSPGPPGAFDSPGSGQAGHFDCRVENAQNWLIVEKHDSPRI